MSKQQNGGKKKGHLSLSRTRSRIVYNLGSRDISNKRKKLDRHVKNHPNDNIIIDSIMSYYIKNRKQGKRVSL